MTTNDPDICHNKKRSWFMLFAAAFLFIIYVNSLHVPFLFDDAQNIVDNEGLQWTRLTTAGIKSALFKKGKVYRPLSGLSFAVNYYIGRHQVTGYHIVNIGAHLVTTFFLYKTILLLLSMGRTRFEKDEALFVAGLSVFLWAIHPIQISAVTYIVQRMTVLAAMFYTISLWAYIRGRMKVSSGPFGDVKWLVLSLGAFFCGVLSKENAVLLPAGLFLVELFFIQGVSVPRQQRTRVFGRGMFFLGGCLLIGVCVLYIRKGEDFLGGYDLRPFTLYQRLLTEPRVMWFYVTQLFYPTPEKFSMLHFIPLSKSLFSPLSTLVAVLFILFIIITAFIFGRKWPLWGFPIVFYFVHHSVEASWLPLEIIYEHRNYLPSLFLFLPVSIICFKTLHFYEHRNRWVWKGCVVILIAALVFLGLLTHHRNYQWRSVKSFWEHELAATPELTRPYLGLGYYYTRQESMDLDRAAAFFKEGTQKRVYHNKFEIADLWLNLARTYKQRQNFREAKQLALKSRDLYQEIIDKTPVLKTKASVKKAFSVVYAMLAEICSHENMEEALAFINQAIDLHGSNNYYKMKANYLMHAGRYEEAIEIMRLLLRASPEDWRVFLGLGQAMTLTGHLSRGIWYYKQYLNRAMNSHALFSPVYLYLSENRYLAGEGDWGDRYLHQFLDMTPHHSMISFLKKMQHGHPDIAPFVDKGKMLVKIGDSLCAY